MAKNGGWFVTRGPKGLQARRKGGSVMGEFIFKRGKGTLHATNKRVVLVLRLTHFESNAERGSSRSSA
ncbi:MAG: hypothetical protein ACE5QF_03580 [Thermoplasmata archaeon]